MATYCLKCKTRTNDESITHTHTSNGRTLQLSRCIICKGKKARFISSSNNQQLTKTQINKIKKMYNSGHLDEIINLIKTNQITPQEGKGLLGNLFGFQLPDNVKNIPVLGPLLNFIA